MVLPTIYCINLVSDTARRQRMEARFAFHGLTANARFVEALAPADERVIRIATGEGGSAVREIARLQSHLTALRTFLADDSSGSGAIVMEDNVVLHNNFEARFSATLSNIPTGTPVVALEYMVREWVGISWSGIDPSTESLATMNAQTVWKSRAYWISRDEAARALIRLDRALDDMPIGVTSEAIVHARHALVAYPALALVESNDSDTMETRWFSYADYSAAERQTRSATIALCMIVKNEAAVIERCLQSVQHLIDSWVICDTGSSDSTIDIIERSLRETPGTLHRVEWTDFGHNRTELLRLARGTADYLLLLDADQTLLEVGFLPPIDEQSTDAFRLRHQDGIEYDVERLVRGNLPWRYEGRTHEYLTCDEHGTISTLLDAWQVIHHGDGGSRSDKFERDRTLLELTLAERPDDPRSTFYLGQTLETLGERAPARRAYLRRAQLGAFEEEAWYAQWRAAALFDGEPTTALAEFIAAWERRPSRVEPLYDAILLCEAQGWWSEAVELCTAGIVIERPDDILFVHSWLYEQGMRDAHDRVALASGSTPNSAADQLHNETAPGEATEPATLLEAVVSKVTFAQVSINALSGWPAFNPSITSRHGELAMIVRTSNYRILRDGSYEWSVGDGVRTQNFFVCLDTFFGVIDSRPMVDRSGRTTHPTSVQGIEDCRLFALAGEWRFVGTTRDSRPDGVARMVVGKLDLSSEQEVAVTDVVVLPAPVDQAHEKNWAPWVVDDQLRLVYSWLPREVLAWNEDDNALTLVENRADSVDRARWRGSTQGIDTEAGTLFVVHEVDDSVVPRRYLHRFVVVDPSGQTRASELFSFTGSPIEFAAGIALFGDRVLVSFGIHDSVAAIAVLQLDAVIQLCVV